MKTRRTPWLVTVAALVALSGCADNGQSLNVCDNPDLRCDDGNACTADRCDPKDGCVNERISCNDRDACTADRCDEAIGCVNTALTCDDANKCTTDTCEPTRGCVNSDISATCDDHNACTVDSCKAASGCSSSILICDDSNECTAESCERATGCHSDNVVDGTSCNRGLGRCLTGVCEAAGCVRDADCNDNDACTQDRCNLETHQCANTDISASCDDGNACTADTCVPATGCKNTDNAARCDDSEECTIDRCVPATGCVSDAVEDTTPCDGGTGACREGTCLSLNMVEYQQDFEALDRTNTAALGADGWVVYGNVFEPGTETFLYGYGPYAAPNDGVAFCAVAEGQGGAEQGNQQLSVYNDYNNSDHANGQLIESNVYRERAITALDVGRTITFSFDAKRGNINDPADEHCPCTSRAVAFVKTLNPAAGYATTNLLREDMTALSESWDRHEIVLPIDAGLVDQLLQVGFATTATLYQPSGNFYDNIKVSNSPTVP